MKRTMKEYKVAVTRFQCEDFCVTVLKTNTRQILIAPIDGTVY